MAMESCFSAVCEALMVAAAASFTTNVKVKLPALVGVPLINPVDEFRLRPAGSVPH